MDDSFAESDTTISSFPETNDQDQASTASSSNDFKPRVPLHDSSLLSSPRCIISDRRDQDHSFPSPSRSISLPQKLTSINFSNNNSDSNKMLPSSRLVNQNPQFLMFKKCRVTSESEYKPVGRSNTEPKINEILRDGETEDLGINKVSEDPQDSPSQQFNNLSIHELNNNCSAGSAQRALSTPDILLKIIEQLDSQTVIPQELVQQRRKPLSLRHAQLIFGKTQRAVEAWQKQTPATTEYSGSGLYNCLFVNKFWHDIALRVLESCIHFRDHEQWIHFARRGAHTLTRKPKALILHKLSQATQVELELFESENLGERLEWLEFYTCARISPTKGLLGERLTKIVLPGCNRVSDKTLVDIASRCPYLEHLDVRACSKVSDAGVKIIARYCRNLQLINVGRTQDGEKITYKAIKHLARLTNISTLGLAGCDIDDRAIWELALNRGPHLERLSLNNCRYLTDAGLPRVLGYMPNLTVLEIRGCIQITNMRPIGLLKLYNERKNKHLLIEGCEVIERRIQVATMRLRRECSNRLLSDLTSWINRPHDDDHMVNVLVH